LRGSLRALCHNDRDIQAADRRDSLRVQGRAAALVLETSRLVRGRLHLATTRPCHQQGITSSGSSASCWTHLQSTFSCTSKSLFSSAGGRRKAPQEVISKPNVAVVDALAERLSKIGWPIWAKRFEHALSNPLQPSPPSERRKLKDVVTTRFLASPRPCRRASGSD